jgi:hypothetical protein
LLETSTAKACKEGRFFYLTDLFAEDVAKREVASILRCDLLLMIRI